jgi:hypothetical protein
MSSAFADNIAIHPRTGVAYAIDFIFEDSLYTVNLSNGAMTLVGGLGLGNVSAQCGTAFLGETLYALTSVGDIYTIDLTSGAATLVASTGSTGWEGLAIGYDACDDPADLEAFGSTFSNATRTRGFWFEAPRDFLICGLRVPDEAGAGVQNVEVIRLNAPPPLFSTTTNDFESLFRAVGVDGANVIPAGVPVREGDIIGILGATGTATMNNSYATNNESILTIGGSPTTIKRMGMQFNLNSTPAQDIWTENGGPVSRVEMYYMTSADISLDLESPATGSTLDTTPLNTSLGTITGTDLEIGSIAGGNSDPEFIRAGAGGNNIDIINSSTVAELSFDFDVTSLTFVYGGNNGVFDIEALNSGGGIVDAFMQGSTASGEPAGPITLAGEGIRSIRWRDTGGVFSAMDNIKITGEGAGCYADCDGNNVLDVFDFLCFQDAFVTGCP